MHLQVAVVVSLFGYPGNTALAVGMNMAQIGEFAFILLSVASELNLVANNVYMLLMGVTALSLLVTPLLLQLSTRVQPHVRAVSLALADVELAPAPLVSVGPPAYLPACQDACLPAPACLGPACVLHPHALLHLPDAGAMLPRLLRRQCRVLAAGQTPCLPA